MATGILRDLADGAKRVGEIKKEFSDLEFNERILELRQLLMSAQTEILTLREDNLDLKATIADLHAKEERAAALVVVEGFKYESVEGKPSGLPFCPTCDAKENILIRLSRSNQQYSRCLNCKCLHNAAQNGRVNIDNPPTPKRARRQNYIDY